MKITIITSCTRPDNLPRLYESIDFSQVDKWIIVYDTSKGQKYTWRYKKDKRILEAECPHSGVLGYAQKNFGLRFVDKGSVYFLDDDTIMHPDFWKVLKEFKEDTTYLFDQETYKDMSYLECSDSLCSINMAISMQKKTAKPTLLQGSRIHTLYINEGMCLIPYEHLRDTEFIQHLYYAGGIFVTGVQNEHSSKSAYVPIVLSYGSKL
jgi:hypothetical protein